MLISADCKDGTRGLKTRLTVAGTVGFFFFFLREWEGGARLCSV